MTRRELISNVLRGQRGERIARAVFGGGRWACRQTGLRLTDLVRDPLHFAGRIAELYAGLDTDMVFAGSGLNTLPAEAIGGVLEFREEQAPLLSFPLIQKPGDANALGEIDIAHSEHSLALIETIRSLRQSLPDRFVCATTWGPFTWAMILCDWEFLRLKTADDPGFIREMCDLGVRLSLALLEPLLREGLIDGISVPDGAVTLVPEELYRQTVLPCERRLFERVRSLGGKSIFHQCGNISGQIAFYPDAGADCISVDAGVDIGEVYDLYRGRVVTAGNVDVVNTIFAKSTEAVCEAVAACIGRVADPFDKYILMPSCDPPPETPLRNIREFLRCADRI